MKRIAMIIWLLLVPLFVLTACGSDPLGLGDLGEDALVCKITGKDRQELTVTVMDGDLHYDPDEVLMVKYHGLEGGTELKVGDHISFIYDYLNDVTVKNGYPYINVDTVTVTQWTPLETTIPAETH